MVKMRILEATRYKEVPQLDILKDEERRHILKTMNDLEQEKGNYLYKKTSMREVVLFTSSLCHQIYIVHFGSYIMNIKERLFILAPLQIDKLLSTQFWIGTGREIWGQLLI